MKNASLKVMSCLFCKLPSDYVRMDQPDQTREAIEDQICNYSLILSMKVQAEVQELIQQRVRECLLEKRCVCPLKLSIFVGCENTQAHPGPPETEELSPQSWEPRQHNASFSHIQLFGDEPSLQYRVWYPGHFASQGSETEEASPQLGDVHPEQARSLEAVSPQRDAVLPKAARSVQRGQSVHLFGTDSVIEVEDSQRPQSPEKRSRDERHVPQAGNSQKLRRMGRQEFSQSSLDSSMCRALEEAISVPKGAPVLGISLPKPVRVPIQAYQPSFADKMASLRDDES